MFLKITPQNVKEPDIYFCVIETAMHVCLREVLRQCRIALRKMLTKRDRWVKEWPGQPGITSTQIQWTTDCTRTLLHCRSVLHCSR